MNIAPVDWNCKREKEIELVRLMVGIYCHGNHDENRGTLCPQCAVLADYACTRVQHCPHMETKTFCAQCKTHCYKPEMREKIRAVMRYAGPRMLFYHPGIALRHVVQTLREKRQITKPSKKEMTP